MFKKDNTKIKKKRRNIDSSGFYPNLFKVSSVVVLIIGVFYAIYQMYFTPEKTLSRGCRHAIEILQNEADKMYASKGYVFDQGAANDGSFCNTVGTKYSKFSVKCYNTDIKKIMRNFTIWHRVTIYGLEKPLTKSETEAYKDIVIDVNGDFYPNKIGVDRVPVRIYSEGPHAGEIMPVNCNKQDEAIYGYKISKYCSRDSETNYLAQNVPFGYNVIYYGADAASLKRNVLEKNVSYLAADCKAKNGQGFAGTEYCENAPVPWLYRCYEKGSCEFVVSKQY
ncbi:hypothetical protein IJ670_03255 [bacterium]|nr:hypothetical protein [bacterium]